MTELEPVVLLGSGDEACTLARLAARAGCAVRLHHPDRAQLSEARRRIREAVAAELRTGQLDPVARQRVFDGIFATSDLAEAVRHAGFVFAPEAKPAREHRALVLQLGQACRASTVIAIGSAPYELLDGFPHPGRLIGVRLPQNAARGTGPIEIVVTRLTAAHVVERICAFAHRLGRVPRLRGQGATAGRAAARV